MKNSLNIKISSSSLLRYALPTMISSILMNVYSLVDSLFVSNLIGTDALSAVNIAAPLLAISLAIGTMIATGGSALVSKQLGQGKDLEAKQNFTMFLLFCVMASAVLCAIGFAYREPILRMMGADDVLYPLCEAYATPLFVIIPFAMVGMLLQIFFVAAGNPGLGLVLSLSGGVINIILDYVLIAIIPLGVAGAAYATGAGYMFQGLVGLSYFAFKRDGALCLVKPRFNGKALLKACSNGLSEMVGMLAVSITMMAMNIIMMKQVGSDGVAAAAIVLAAQTVLSAVYMGYSQGIAPIISFNHGGQNYENLKMIYRKALRTIGVMSVITFVATFPLAGPIARLYAEGVDSVVGLATEGIMVVAGGFLLMGINLFASAMFTALNDGKVSAILALFRTLVFLMIPLMVFPPIFGAWGVWVAIPAAEVLSVAMSVYYFKRKKEVYHYA